MLLYIKPHKSEIRDLTNYADKKGRTYLQQVAIQQSLLNLLLFVFAIAYLLVQVALQRGRPPNRRSVHEVS
jgi:flagellar biogenesis protein FliO